MITNRLKPKSEFSKNVLTLMTGTTIAQAIPIAISPILTRIYTPEDFGVLSLFIAITAIFGSIINGSYEQAIILPRKDEDAINILALGFILNLSMSIFLLILVVLFNDYFTVLLNNDEISIWLYFMPFVVFLIGFFNLLNYFNNRKKYYKDLAKVNVYRSLALSITQLSLGFIKLGAIGLISGQIISQLFAIGKLVRNVHKLDLLKKISKNKIIALAKKYVNFLKFTTLNNLMDSIRQYGFNLLISSIYSLVTLGQYYLAQKIIYAPMTIIGNSISQVLLQKMATSRKSELYEMSINYIIKTSIIFIPIFIILYIYSIQIFIVVFGDKWVVAGEIVSILTPWVFLSLLTSPLSNIYAILKKQEILLFYSIGYALIPIILILSYNNSFIEMIKSLSYLMSIVLIIFLAQTIYILKKEKNV